MALQKHFLSLLVNSNSALVKACRKLSKIFWLKLAVFNIFVQYAAKFLTFYCNRYKAPACWNLFTVKDITVFGKIPSKVLDILKKSL